MQVGQFTFPSYLIVGVSGLEVPHRSTILERMCNLYSQTSNVEAIRRLFRVSSNRAASFEPKDAIFPGHMAPVVRNAQDDERELVELSWGFIRLQPGKAPRRVTNTRDDNLQSTFWRSSFKDRRCLIPATSFCEPNSDVKPATWNWFALAGDESRPVFAFAGIWRAWNGPIKKDSTNVAIDVFSFMTTTPNALVETVNHERMPVLLATPQVQDQWMDGTDEEAFAACRPYPPELMRLVQPGYEKRDLLATGISNESW